MDKKKNKAGKALAACRVPKTFFCAVCSVEFTALNRAKFCSNRCKQKDKYYKNKEAE